MRRLCRALPAWACLVVIACASPPAARRPVAPTGAPEASSGWIDKPGWSSNTWMVAAANPRATEAGAAMLERGGSAVDAAIAVQMVLTLVEPQSSGIGGGAFLLHWDGRSVAVLDGRETAPAAATDELFLRDGVPLPLTEAIVGGRSVGAPGVLRMLALAHQRYGTLPWADLFAPAIRLAEDGFDISPRLASLLAGEKYLMTDPEARAYFYQADGQPKTVGTRLRNPALAAVLRRLATEGVEPFYTGDLARAIVAKVRAHPTNPGVLQEADLAAYRPVEREPLCFPYRTVKICGVPPPGSGTIALAEILGALEPRDLSSMRPSRRPDGGWTMVPEAVHLYAEAARLAYADRDAYVGDPAFTDVPVAGLIDPAYIAGRALAMTTTIEDGFGSRQMVQGFLLNNQLTDFSLAPRTADGRLVANRVEPGKRPRSSMTPLLVFDRDSGRLRMSLGSPGGSSSINYVGKVLVGTIDWGLDVQAAISLPNVGSRNGPTELEAGRVDPALVAALEARGHQVRLIEQTSGLQAIERTPTGWFAGADPRREGTARGK